MDTKEGILKLVDDKVNNLKELIRQHTRNDKNMVNTILSMVGSEEYLTIGKQYLTPLKQKKVSFKPLVDGMLTNFNINDNREIRAKLERYLVFFCDMTEKLANIK